MVWLNGAFLGASKDSRLPAEFEVTGRLQPGDNLLAVQVGVGLGGDEEGTGGQAGYRLGGAPWQQPPASHPAAPLPPRPHRADPRAHTAPRHQVTRWSDATYLEDQDMWRLSGLHRDVLLLSKPADACISDFSVRTPLAWPAASDRAGGPPSEAGLEVDVRLEVAGGSTRGTAPGFGLDAAAADAAEALKGVRVVAHLFDEEGRPVLGAPLECSIVQVGRKGRARLASQGAAQTRQLILSGPPSSPSSAEPSSPPSTPSAGTPRPPPPRPTSSSAPSPPSSGTRSPASAPRPRPAPPPPPARPAAPRAGPGCGCGARSGRTTTCW
jgi:hypothetical protein